MPPIRLVALVVATAILPHLARAQDVAHSEQPSAPASPPIAAWVSLGLGEGGIRGASLLAGVARVNVSVGPVMVTYRAVDVGPFIAAGDGVHDNALLAGVRSGGKRLFASAQLGYANAHAYHKSDSDVSVDQPSDNMLAYDATLHADALYGGLAASIAGALGPARSSYVTFTLSAELGWFGR